MTNDELQMTKEIRSSKVERRAGVRSAVSSFRYSFGLRHSLFGNTCSPPGRGWGWVGSGRASSASRPRMGTLNPTQSPSTALRAPSPPLGEKDGMRGSGSWRASSALLPCIGTMNPPLAPPRRGTERRRNAGSTPGRGEGWVGSSKAPFPFRACIGTTNRSRRGDAAADLRIAISAATSHWRLPSCFLALLTLLAVGLFTSTSLAATFTASLDRATISLHESATMSLRFEGGLPADLPAVPNVPGLTIASIGQSSQFNFINGQSSSIVSYNFLVRAAQPGDYTIPALSALVDGKTLTSQPLKLKVLKSGQPTPDSEVIGKNAFLKLVAAKNEVYLGEVLPVEIRLYARQGN